MAGINTRVGRRTNELLNNIYGDNYEYNDGSPTVRGPPGLTGATTSGMVTGRMARTPPEGPTRSTVKNHRPSEEKGLQKKQREMVF
jgi:hypothetical protein